MDGRNEFNRHSVKFGKFLIKGNKNISVIIRHFNKVLRCYVGPQSWDNVEHNSDAIP
jgi:hypothetical protein